MSPNWACIVTGKASTPCEEQVIVFVIKLFQNTKWCLSSLVCDCVLDKGKNNAEFNSLEITSYLQQLKGLKNWIWLQQTLVSYLL